MAREAVDSAAAAASRSSNPRVPSDALGRPTPNNLTFQLVGMRRAGGVIEDKNAGRRNRSDWPVYLPSLVFTSRSDEDLTRWGSGPPPSRARVVGRVPRGNESSGASPTCPCASGDVFRRRGGSADAEPATV